MFEWSLGLWPFKDTFYTNTSSGQNLPLNGQDRGQSERQPYTHTVIAALSGGGVAPGDVVGGSNVGLLMSTCRQDGTLLKPTTPSSFIDRFWGQAGQPPAPAPSPRPTMLFQACQPAQNHSNQRWALSNHSLQAGLLKNMARPAPSPSPYFVPGLPHFLCSSSRDRPSFRTRITTCRCSRSQAATAGRGRHGR